MRRLAALLLLAALFLTTSCGQVFVRGALNAEGAQAISGTVSIVQLSFISGSSGTSITITAVTLISATCATSINFCGDQRSRFPLNQQVKANFMPGSACSNLIVVVNL
jgi:hypothetical protein